MAWTWDPWAPTNCSPSREHPRAACSIARRRSVDASGCTTSWSTTSTPPPFVSPTAAARSCRSRIRCPAEVGSCKLTTRKAPLLRCWVRASNDGARTCGYADARYADSRCADSRYAARIAAGADFCRTVDRRCAAVGARTAQHGPGAGLRDFGPLQLCSRSNVPGWLTHDFRGLDRKCLVAG